jgi:hypothetical protein
MLITYVIAIVLIVVFVRIEVYRILFTSHWSTVLIICKVDIEVFDL